MCVCVCVCIHVYGYHLSYSFNYIQLIILYFSDLHTTYYPLSITCVHEDLFLQTHSRAGTQLCVHTCLHKCIKLNVLLLSNTYFNILASKCAYSSSFFIQLLCNG